MTCVPIQQLFNLQTCNQMCLSVYILYISITMQNLDDRDVTNEWILTCVHLN